MPCSIMEENVHYNFNIIIKDGFCVIGIIPFADRYIICCLYKVITFCKASEYYLDNIWHLQRQKKLHKAFRKYICIANHYGWEMV